MADRPEPGLIKWSPNPRHDSFLHINLQHRIIQLYDADGHAQAGRFDWTRQGKHDDVPPLTTFDWSPSVPGLVAVGTATGVVNLLRVDDNSNAYMELNLKLSRTCQAVAFNTEGKLAVGLDRVRNDSSLCIWDVNRLSLLSRPGSTGFQNLPPFTDPTDRSENGTSVTSLKFFEDNPDLLIAGVKLRGLIGLFDLRDRPLGPATTFRTNCCNNLAIDYADPHYFASSALDQPGVMVWDRRATKEAVFSHKYADAVEKGDVPTGGALRLNRAMDMETDPMSMDNKDSFIRSIRFSRDQPGMLAVLSRTGQLKVMSTKREHPETITDFSDSPQLLEVSKSHELDPQYSDQSRKNDKIVSFDWITLKSCVLRPRVMVLRANGAFEVLEKPSFTSEHVYKVVPWQAPYRGLEEGSSYHNVMEFEPSQASDLLGPLFTESLLTDVPLFGTNKVDVEAVVKRSRELSSQYKDIVVDALAEEAAAPLDLNSSLTVAEKLQALRIYSEETSARRMSLAKDGVPNSPGLQQRDDESQVQRKRHERLLHRKMEVQGLPSQGHIVLDHIMLLRAKEKYLFHTKINQKVVADDPWLQDVWAWVAGAEEAAADDGMKSYPLDVSYMGVYGIWMNDLGSKPNSRLTDGVSQPDVNGWERIMNGICQRQNIVPFEGAKTMWPNHRRVCLRICNLGRDPIADEDIEKPSSVTWATMTAARALFRGDLKEAVRVLKKASTSHQELFFVSLALQTMGTHGLDPETRKTLDLDAAIASGSDPYLRALSTVIATGDWGKIADQTTLPLRDRVFVAVKYFPDDELADWLERQVSEVTDAGDLEGIVLTGITDTLVDILARYVERYHDYQTATLLLSTCAPRFVDDIRATAFRNAYRAYLQRHHAFYLRTKFEVESTKRSKHLGRPTILPAGRQISLRCVYCDAEMSLLSSNPLSSQSNRGPTAGLHVGQPNASPKTSGTSGSGGNPYTEKMIAGGISCPNCKRHLPRCAVCLEVVGLPDRDGGGLGRFPTFCLTCEHVLHLDHATEWFARHQECPVPECRCKCNFRANPELNYH